jgi:hypothetical protein
MEIELYKGEKSFTAELKVDEETGEVIGGEYLSMLVQRNPVGTIAFILTEAAKKEMIDARIKELQAASKVIGNNAERAKESLKYVMQVSSTTKIESTDKTFKAVLSKGRDESIEVFDEKQIPADYMREIPVSYSPDKTLIKKAIKDGYEVPGAKLVAKDRLTLG